MTTTICKTISAQSLPAISNEKDDLSTNEEDPYELLRKKKQALEETLNLKILQLKSLCLKEAEMIGELPPETPLGPGEPIPQIRKRVGAEFNINQSLLHKAKSLDEETLTRLELELELQRKIVKANLKLSSEIKLKRSVRKRRLQSYQEAIQKLKELEKRWIEARKAMEELTGCDKHENLDKEAKEAKNLCRKQGSTLLGRPKSSLANRPEFDSELVDDFTEKLASKSAPSTPMFRDPDRILRTDLSAPDMPDFISISNSSDSRYSDIRPASMHFHFEKDHDDRISEGCKAAERFSREFEGENCSIGSASSADSSIFRLNNGSKRKNILSLLHSRGSYESLDIVGSHLYTLPSANATLNSNFRCGDHGKAGSSEKPLGTDSNKATIKTSIPVIDNLSRHDSLDRVRKKCYLSAIQSHIPPPNRQLDDHLYQNQESLTDILQANSPPLSPPDLLPTSSRSYISSPSPIINMASRPLPSPPVSSPASSSRSSPSPSSSIRMPYLSRSHNFNNLKQFYHHKQSSDSVSFNSADLYQNIADVQKVSELRPDISSRAVRSSIIRTPIAITVSSSSNEPTPKNRSQPTPPPSLPPRALDNLSGISINSSKLEDVTYTAKSITIPSDPELSPCYVMSPVKSWTETDLDYYPINSKNSKKSGIITPAPTALASSNSSCSNVSICQRFADSSDSISVHSHFPSDETDEVATIMSKSQQETRYNITNQPPRSNSRAPSIPMSPNLPPPPNGVEVNIVSVGHFQPYWEETKPYETADFYKYSAKHRRRAASSLASSSTTDIPNANLNSGATSSIIEDGVQKVDDSDHMLRSSIHQNPASQKSEEKSNWYENDIKRPTIV